MYLHCRQRNPGGPRCRNGPANAPDQRRPHRLAQAPSRVCHDSVHSWLSPYPTASAVGFGQLSATTPSRAVTVRAALLGGADFSDPSSGPNAPDQQSERPTVMIVCDGGALELWTRVRVAYGGALHR